MPSQPATLVVATILLLVATAVAPLVGGAVLFLNAAALALAGVAVVAWRVSPRAPELGASWPRGRHDRSPRRGVPLWITLEMVLALSPVLLLTVLFPVAVSRISDVQVGRVPLTMLLLASSLTTPWLSMAVCLPLYRAVGHLLPATDLGAVRARLAEVWPVTFLQSAPAVLLFVVPVELVMRWPVTAVLAYLGLCVLHAAFAQSLVLVNIGRDRLLWAAAWVGYATALLLVPAAWFLPPLVGLLTQLVPLRAELHRLRRWERLDHRDVAMDVVRGLLLGSVLWAHLLFLFLKTHGGFNVTTVFLALLPAVLAYNYYFVRQAPSFDRAVLTLRSAMENEPQRSMSQQSLALYQTVKISLGRTAFIGAVLGFTVVYVAATVDLASAAMVGTVAVASWLFLMVTLLCYKLDYLGQRGMAQGFSAASLALAAAAFLLLPAGAALYAWLTVPVLLLFVVVLRQTLGQWRASEYALFWRHATAW